MLLRDKKLAGNKELKTVQYFFVSTQSECDKSRVTVS